MYKLVVLLFAAFVVISFSERTFLVNLSEEEVVKIINCITEARDPELCGEFNVCVGLMAKQVIDAFGNCLQEVTQGKIGNCTESDPLFPNNEIPGQIIDCMNGNITELTEDERKMMIEHEECALNLDVDEDCKNS